MVEICDQLTEDPGLIRVGNPAVTVLDDHFGEDAPPRQVVQGDSGVAEIEPRDPGIPTCSGPKARPEGMSASASGVGPGAFAPSTLGLVIVSHGQVADRPER
jgi:hypothetical protein